MACLKFMHVYSDYQSFHNLEVSKTPQEVGHNSRPYKDSRVHSGFKKNKQTMTTQKIVFTNSRCTVFKCHKHLCLHCKQFQPPKNTTFHYVCPQFPMHFWYSSTATFTELYIFAVYVMWPNICVLKSHKIWIACCSKIETICPFQES